MEKGSNPRDDQSIVEDGLVRPIYHKGRYANPFDTFKDQGLLDAFLFLTSPDHSGLTRNNDPELDRTLPIVQPDYDKLNNPPADRIQTMWIGHATILVQLEGLSILTYPVFSTRCGPNSWIGAKRFRKTPCKVEDLPNIDAVLISHNHYDHLDYASVKDLNRKFGDSVTWFVAERQGQWMKDMGCQKVVELTWWQEHQLEKNGKQYMFAATPCQHWCKRTPTDSNKALWCSWVVQGPDQSFFFAGDTAYCSAFKQIGQKYGPFSLSAIPIGAYEPRWFLKPQHADPEEALQIHKDVKSKQSIGIHWGTFKLSSEFYLEPKMKIAELLKENGLPTNTFVTLKHGEVIIPEDLAD